MAQSIPPKQWNKQELYILCAASEQSSTKFRRQAAKEDMRKFLILQTHAGKLIHKYTFVCVCIMW